MAIYDLNDIARLREMIDFFYSSILLVFYPFSVVDQNRDLEASVFPRHSHWMISVSLVLHHGFIRIALTNRAAVLYGAVAGFEEHEWGVA
jgi:hypothetical protein